jgi:hypothetical protein
MSKMSSEGADAPATEVFTAVTILNREGHAPETADRSAQPQHRLDVDPGGEPDKRGATRGGAIAGGAVLAGGAALGVAIFADPEPTAGETALAGGDGGEDAYPGEGLLDPEVSAEAPFEPVVIDPAASTGSLDDGARFVSHGAVAGVPTASLAPSGHDPALGGAGGAGGGDDTAFGTGSGSGSDTSGGDTGGGDTAGGDEGGFLGVGSDEGILNTGLLASDSESSGDESESSGDSGGEDDGGGGLLDTGLLG